MSQTRTRRVLIGICATMVVLLPILVITISVLYPDAEFVLRRRGSTMAMPVSKSVGLTLLLPVIGYILFVVFTGLRNTLRGPREPAGDGTLTLTLSLGEPVVWTGRPAWRTFRGPRVIVGIFAVSVPVLLLLWFWNIWSSSDSFRLKLFWSLLPSFLLFGSVAPALVSGSGIIHAWLCDVFGAVTITDRRVAWLTPWKRRIYRQIAKADIVDVWPSYESTRRGSLTIIKRRRDDVEHVYLHGLPKVEAAQAAIQALVTRNAQ